MSSRLAREYSWLTGMMVVTGWLIQAPLAYVTSGSGAPLGLFGADGVFFVLLAGVFLEAVALFYMFGAGTSLVLGERRENHSSD